MQWPEELRRQEECARGATFFYDLENRWRGRARLAKRRFGFDGPSRWGGDGVVVGRRLAAQQQFGHVITGKFWPQSADVAAHIAIFKRPGALVGLGDDLFILLGVAGRGLLESLQA